MNSGVERNRDNPGHSFEVLPDLCPYEVDKMPVGSQRNESIDVRRRQNLDFSSTLTSTSGPMRVFTPTKPAVLFYDGRAYNQLSEHLFSRDPCKYYRNIQPFKPQHPVSFIPAPGHYQGLGKPPVRQYFKLTPMRVHESRVMPSYELLDNETVCRYYKRAA